MNPPLAYTETLPETALLPFVRRFWQFEHTGTQTLHHTLLPDGFFDLVVKIMGNQVESTSLFGIWTTPLHVEIPGGTRVLGISFNPLAAVGLFRQSIAPLKNAETRLAEGRWNIEKSALLPYGEFVCRVSAEMQADLTPGKPPAPWLAEVFRLLSEAEGQLTIQALSEKVCRSRRQLNRDFNAWFGLSVKSYASLLQCFAACIGIRDGDLFPEAGFYDQSHCIRQIRKHTGTHPAELHQNQNDRFLQFSTSAKP